MRMKDACKENVMWEYDERGNFKANAKNRKVLVSPAGICQYGLDLMKDSGITAEFLTSGLAHSDGKSNLAMCAACWRRFLGWRDAFAKFQKTYAIPFSLSAECIPQVAVRQRAAAPDVVSLLSL